MPQILIILGVLALDIAVVLLRLKMNWLGMLPTVIYLVGAILLATILSKKFLRRRREPLPFLRFKPIVITLSVMFCTIMGNVGSQLAQKQVFGHLYITDSSRETYEERNGKVKEIIGHQLTESQAKTFALIQMSAHTLISVCIEEVVLRWIILGALILILPPFWAVLISSLIFAGTHLIFPIAMSDLEWGLMRLLPTFAIGLGCGIVYLWYGLPAAVLVHFGCNLIRFFGDNGYYFAIDWMVRGGLFVTFILLPPTLWFTRNRRRDVSKTNVNHQHPATV